MGKSSTLNMGAGAFVLLGFAALAFLTTQTTVHGPHLGRPGSVYDVTAKFDNIGDLKVGAPVSMAGVEVGRVVRISLDPKQYKAVVLMQLDSKFDQIPSDSDASIYTQGLLGGKFIGLTAGGSDTYLKNHDQIDFTQSAIVLENLIGQLVSSFTNKGSDSSGSSGSSNSSGSAPSPAPSPKPEKPK
jgi:phospholipid/cholesterol/gamma-HCH transport system substrate-binding protein